MKIKIFSVIILVLLSEHFILAQPDIVFSKDSTAVSYIDKGKGETLLVFVHGLSIDKTYWASQIDYFSKNYRVAAVDLAGHGKSGKTRKNYSVEKYAEDVAAVINKIDARKVILIGHSMGGAIIIEAAKLLRGKVIGLIGVDTYHDLQMKYPREEIDKFIQGFRTDFKKNTKEFVQSMFAQDADSAAVLRVENDFVNADPEIAISTLVNLFSYDEQEKMKGMHVPIISINSDLYPTNLGANKKIADFSVKIIKGTGHFPMIEKPEEFNKLLEEAAGELISGK